MAEMDEEQQNWEKNKKVNFLPRNTVMHYSLQVYFFGQMRTVVRFEKSVEIWRNYEIVLKDHK